jgi:hypothetical protein
MTTSGTQRHPFLDDLAENVTLISSILREPVTGRALVLKVVKSTASLYLDQRPQFLGSIEGRSFFVYEVDLAAEEKVAGLVSIVRNDAGEVTDLNIAFSPLGSVMSLAAGVKAILSGELGPDLFL